MKRILLKSEILKSEVKKTAHSSTSEKPYPTITKPTVFTHQPWGLREKRWEILEKVNKGFYMIDRNRIEEYLTSFEHYFRPFLRQGTKVKTNVFPYNEGTLFVMRFSVDNAASFESEIRSSSPTLYDAIQRTGVLSVNDKSQRVQKKTLLLGSSSLVFVIPDNMFSVDSAESDVNLIVKSIRKK